MSIRQTILDASNRYQNMGLATIVGYCYLTQKGKKGFIPDTPEAKVPYWKINALQVVPGNLAIVVDLDSKEIKLPCIIPSDTVTTISQSGNLHYWFKPDTRLRPMVNNHLKIDLLTGMKPVLVPPSKVFGGGWYEWKVPLLNLSDLKPLPEELLQYLLSVQVPVKIETKTVYRTRSGNKRVSDLSPKQQSSLYNALSKCQTASLGSRSEPDFGLVFWGLSCGLSESAIWDFCCGVSKFSGRRGIEYFQKTLKKASEKLGLKGFYS